MSTPTPRTSGAFDDVRFGEDVGDSRGGDSARGGGDTRDDYDFCWFLLVFVVFLMFFSATGEMKRE